MLLLLFLLLLLLLLFEYFSWKGSICREGSFLQNSQNFWLFHVVFSSLSTLPLILS